MRMRLLMLTPAALAIIAMGACGSDATDDTTTEPTPAAGKTDCPDCDPAGPNAFIQTKIGDRFYQAGDSWQVAFTFRGAPFQEKNSDMFLGEDGGIGSEAFLFDYRVLKVERDIFDNVQREVATVEITQGELSGPNAALFGQERLDKYEHKVVFEINDLLDPVSETTYSQNYPHGNRQELDSKSTLKGVGSIFPRTIPRLLVNGGIDSPAPDLPADLADIVDITDSDWSKRTYIKYRFDNGDVAFWTVNAGRLWPFYVENQQGAAVLTGWNN